MPPNSQCYVLSTVLPTVFGGGGGGLANRVYPGTSHAQVRVWRLGFGVWGFGVWGLGFRV